MPELSQEIMERLQMKIDLNTPRYDYAVLEKFLLIVEEMIRTKDQSMSDKEKEALLGVRQELKLSLLLLNHLMKTHG